MIRITSRKDGFRRCGVPHSAHPTDWPDDWFTDEELARLQDEPMLIVEVLDTINGQDLEELGEGGLSTIDDPIDQATAGEKIDSTVEERPNDAEPGEPVQPESGDLAPVPESKPTSKRNRKEDSA